MFGHWKISKISQNPIYMQIVDIISADIRNGVVRAGSRLPSQRMFMDIFQVSRNTVIAALDKLTKDGLITVKPQSGIHVRDEASTLTTIIKPPDWSKYFRNGIHSFGSTRRLEQLSIIDKVDRVINISCAGFGCDFNLLQPIINLIENKVFKKDETRLIHFNKYGYRPLRQIIAERVARHGINVTENNVLIVPSVLQGINIACMTLMGFGSNFLYERPSVINMDSIVRYMGNNMVPLDMGKDGVVPRQLEQALHTKNSILYLNPTNHNPTGYTMSEKGRLEVLRIANRHRVPIIEVDSLRDMWLNDPFPPSLRALDKADSVIYLGSILRTLTYNISTSWIIASQDVIERFSDVKAQSDIYPSLILQLIAEELLRGGRYDIFLDEMRVKVAKKRDDALVLIKKYFGDIATWDEDRCQLYFWIEFDKRINTKKLFEQVRDVEFYPGFFFDDNDTTHISIFPAGVAYDDLDEGLYRLNKSIRTIFKV